MTSPASPRIRSGTGADAWALAQLRFEFRASIDPATEPADRFLSRCKEWMAHRLQPDAPWRCWVVEQEGELVGMAWVMIIDKLPNPVAEPEKHGYISSLYLKPECRGQGVGSRLLSACIGACESAGCDAIFLWPTAGSRSLYQRHGFAVREDLLERRVTPVPAHA